MRGMAAPSFGPFKGGREVAQTRVGLAGRGRAKGAERDVWVAMEVGQASSFALAKALEASGLWKQALSPSEHSALSRRLESQRTWDAFMTSSVQSGDVSLQLKARALLMDRSVSSVAARMGTDPAAVDAAGIGSPIVSAEGSLRRGVEPLQASDVFFTLEDDREEWDSLSSSARASDPWVQGLRKKYRKALSTDPKDSKPGSSGTDSAAPHEEKQRLQRALCRELERVLNELNNLGEAVTPFFYRVKAADAPDYYQVITKPMDLSTVREKVQKGKYSSVEACRKDIDLIVNNCRKYNKPGSTFVAFAQQLQKSAHSLLMTAEGRVAAAKERSKERQEPVDSLPAFRDRLRPIRADPKHPDGGPTPSDRRRDDPGADSLQWYKKERLRSFKPRMELLAERRNAACEPLAERPAFIRSPEAMAHQWRTHSLQAATDASRDQRSAGMLASGAQRWGKKDSLAPQDSPPVLDHLSLRDLANGVPEPLPLRDGTPSSAGSSSPALGGWGGLAQGPGHPVGALGAPPPGDPKAQGTGAKSTGTGSGSGAGSASAGTGAGVGSEGSRSGGSTSAAVARQRLRSVCLRQISSAGFGGGAKSSAVEVLLDAVETHVEGLARQVGSILGAATSAPGLVSLPLLPEPLATAAPSWQFPGDGGGRSLPLQTGLLPQNGALHQASIKDAAPGLGDAVAFLVGLTRREDLGNHGRLPPLSELRRFVSTGAVQGRFQSPLAQVAHHGHGQGGPAAKRKAGGRGGDGVGPSGPAKRSKKESKAAAASADKDSEDREAGGALPLASGATPPPSSPRVVGQGRGGLGSGAGKGTDGVPLAGLGSPSKGRKNESRRGGGVGATLGLGSRAKAGKGGKGATSKVETEGPDPGAESLTAASATAAGTSGLSAGAPGAPLASLGAMSTLPGVLNRNEIRPGTGAPGSVAAFSMAAGSSAALRPAQGVGAPRVEPRAAPAPGSGRASPVADTAGGAPSPSGVHHPLGSFKGPTLGSEHGQGRAVHVLLPPGSDDSLGQGQGQAQGLAGERPAVYRVTSTGSLGSGSPLHMPQSPSSSSAYPPSPRLSANPVHGGVPPPVASPGVPPAPASVPASPGGTFPSGGASPKRWSGSLQAQLQGQQKGSPKLQPLQLPASAEPQRLVLRAQPETSPAKPKVYPGMGGGGPGAMGGGVGAATIGQGVQGGMQAIQGLQGVQSVPGIQGMPGVIGVQGQPGIQEGQQQQVGGGGAQFSALHIMQHSRSLPEMVRQHSQDGQGQAQYGQQAPGVLHRPGFPAAGTPLGGLVHQQQQPQQLQQQVPLQQPQVLNSTQLGVQLQRQVSYPELRRQPSQEETTHGQMAYRPHQGFVQQRSHGPQPSMQQTMMPPQQHALAPQNQASTPKQ